jgi:hypothetical protein
VAETENRPTIWVIDNSSLLEVRRQVPGPDQPDVYSQLGCLVESGVLVYPKEVLEELERNTVEVVGKKGKRDRPYEWAKKHATRATRHGFRYDVLREVLAVPGVAQLVDPSGTKKEADPYLLALAYQLRTAGEDARVVTEDRRNAPDKVALASACGLVGIPVVPMKVFLVHLDIWTGQWGGT